MNGLMNDNKNYPSGCVSSCKYNHELDQCEGCGRSMSEIKEAYRKSMNPHARM